VVNGLRCNAVSRDLDGGIDCKREAARRPRNRRHRRRRAKQISVALDLIDNLEAVIRRVNSGFIARRKR